MRPDFLSIERQFRKGLQLLIPGHVEELLVPFASHLKPVTTALELTSEGFDELTRRIKNKNSGVILLILVPFVNHIETTVLIHRHVVSDLPGVFVRESHPVIDDLILVIPFPDENAGTATRDADCFLAAENTEAGSGGGG